MNLIKEAWEQFIDDEQGQKDCIENDNIVTYYPDDGNPQHPVDINQTDADGVFRVELWGLDDFGEWQPVRHELIKLKKS